MAIGSQRNEKSRNYSFSKDVSRIQNFWLCVALLTLAGTIALTVFGKFSTETRDFHFLTQMIGLHSIPKEVNSDASFSTQASDYFAEIDGSLAIFGLVVNCIPTLALMVFMLFNMRKFSLTALLDLRYDDWASRKGLILITLLFLGASIISVVQCVILYLDLIEFEEITKIAISVAIWVAIDLYMCLFNIVIDRFVKRQLNINLVWTEDTVFRHKFLFQNFLYIVGRGLQVAQLSWAIVSGTASTAHGISLIIAWIVFKLLIHDMNHFLTLPVVLAKEKSPELGFFKRLLALFTCYSQHKGAYEQKFATASVTFQAVTDFLLFSRYSTIAAALCVIELLIIVLWSRRQTKKRHIKEPSGWPFVLIHDLFIILTFSVLIFYIAIEMTAICLASFFFLCFVLVVKIPGPWSAINIMLGFASVAHIIGPVLYFADQNNPQPNLHGEISDNAVFIGQWLIWLAGVFILVVLSTVPILRKLVLKVVEDKIRELGDFEAEAASQAEAAVSALSTSRSDDTSSSSSSSSSSPAKRQQKKQEPVAAAKKDKKRKKTTSSSSTQEQTSASAQAASQSHTSHRKSSSSTVLSSSQKSSEGLLEDSDNKSDEDEDGVDFDQHLAAGLSVSQL